MLLNDLAARCEGKCELCLSTTELDAYTVPPKSKDVPENQIALCSVCMQQVLSPEDIDRNHMRCLNEAIWNPNPPVQVVAYRLLQKIMDESWAQDAISAIYMDDETREWAEISAGQAVVHKDSNGYVLQNGDTIVLIKDLNVKGTTFTAKRGTAVRRIRLDPDNENHIEGKVEGQQIVILTEFVKKSN